MACLEERGLTIDRLHEVLRLDPDTGELFWKIRSRDAFINANEAQAKTWNKRFANKSALTAKGCGGRYKHGNIDGVIFMAHRIVFALFHNRFPNGEVDHINGNKTDNRPENLREVSNQENRMNSSRNSNNTSGFNGVGWHREKRKWRAYVKFFGKQRHIGWFDSAEEAGQAQREAALKLGFHENHGREKV